jgi:hypothetical protein
VCPSTGCSQQQSQQQQCRPQQLCKRQLCLAQHSMQRCVPCNERKAGGEAACNAATAPPAVAGDASTWRPWNTSCLAAGSRWVVTGTALRGGISSSRSSSRNWAPSASGHGNASAVPQQAAAVAVSGALDGGPPRRAPPAGRQWFPCTVHVSPTPEGPWQATAAALGSSSRPQLLLDPVQLPL